ncbi:hypothetical protein BH10PSE19_BH10PSE19_21900 [soil metagenome]
MFEKHHQPLISRKVFLLRLVHSILFAICLIAFGLGIGMLGYHHYEKMTWVEAYVNAAMILSGMGPVSTMTTSAGKIFAGSYALFSGLAFIVIVGMIFGPIVHRWFHKFHLDSK